MTASGPPSEAGVAASNDPMVGPYFKRLTGILESDEDPKRMARAMTRKMSSPYLLAILQMIAETDRLCREMRIVLSEFAGRDYFLGRLLILEHLAIAMKLYVISWSTLLDLISHLINVVFDLGTAERDVRQAVIIRNDHVKHSRIPQILEDYERTSVIRDLRKKRNDLVHRGRVPDNDVEELFAERNTIDSRRYSFLRETHISDEEHKEQMRLFQEKLRALASTKQALFGRHHELTTAMVSEIARELAAKTVEIIKAVDLKENRTV